MDLAALDHFESAIWAQEKLHEQGGSLDAETLYRLTLLATGDPKQARRARRKRREHEENRQESWE